MEVLTLRECLQQPRGYEGRLFQTPDDELGISIPNTNDFTHDYRVLEINGERMDIEGYVLGGRVVEVRDVNLNERLDDRVMSSEDLMEWYRISGKVGSAVTSGMARPNLLL